MATIKSYTDFSQAKKLAEILPLESADMHYHYDNDFGELESIPTITEEDDHFALFPKDFSCWSLAALLSVLPDHFYDETGRKKFGIDKGDCSYYVFYETQNSYIQTSADNPVDACYEMIIKLHEKKIL
jgi:hypothetical protein